MQDAYKEYFDLWKPFLENNPAYTNDENLKEVKMQSNLEKIFNSGEKIYNVKFNTKERIVLFIHYDCEYAVRFKISEDIEKRIEDAKDKIERGQLFFVKNLVDHYFKLKTREQFSEEESKRKYHHLDHNCSIAEPAEI